MTDKIYKAIGLMSGTSLDGVDCALIETDGRAYVLPRKFITIPYTTGEREAIRAAFGKRDRKDPVVEAAEHIVTQSHIAAVKELNKKADVIGFHGQTIFHAPEEKLTLQIGNAEMLARETGMDVVADFRSADVAAGGQGAPLAPAYHAARMHHAGVPLPAAILNIGGVANVTWIGGPAAAGRVIAFDTGPGNALIDDWILRRTGNAFDKDGVLAASGTAMDDYLRVWLSHAYFDRPAPKSLDRGEWDIAALGPLTRLGDNITTEDGAATLMAFTVEGILSAVRHLPDAPKQWFACGGGRRNTAMMDLLQNRLEKDGCGQLHNVEDLGWDGDATEAECFAYLAVRALLNLPISFPDTTGVPSPMTGGVFSPCKG